MASMESTLARWHDHWDNDAPDWVRDEAVERLVAVSEYAAEQLQRYPHIHDYLSAQIDWVDYDFATALSEYCAEHAVQGSSEASLMRALRRFKHTYQVALVYAVVNGHLPQRDFLTALSALAAALVNYAHDDVYSTLCQRFGTPTDEQGQPFAMTILAMGKFGGRELNFSSDIDLIFAYRCQGETDGGERAKPIAYEMFFRKLAQKLIQLLDNVSEDGMVYRVDMRLRPFGQSGPLALSYNACEQYYLVHGRDWERYAMMKARPVAGDIDGGDQLLKALRPFMYRRYLDYAALGAIADMKQEINRQINEEGLQNHIKLGKGGIREAEFSVQAMQLIYGGQYPRLQSPHFLHVLSDLYKLKLCDDDSGKPIEAAYLLLREVENALQFAREQQTHQLPDEQDEAEWARLATACSKRSVAALKSELQQAREVIHHRFNHVFADEAQAEHEDDLRMHWQEPDEQAARRWLLEHDVEAKQAEIISQRMVTFAGQLPWTRLPKRTVSRLDKLLPQIFNQALLDRERLNGIDGILALVSAVCGRGVYIDMLSEQPRLIGHLLDIAAHSQWLMRFICAHPLVLDDVLSERSMVKDAAQLAQDLAARLEGCEDDEEWLHALRDFKHAQVFKIAWADMHDQLSLMEVSDYLSHIATIVLNSAYRRAYRATSKRYGEPRLADGRRARFAIIAYGKLGGLELGYGSDLDLLFLYDQEGEQGETDGKKNIANEQFFTRLVQRLNNYLSASSASGMLYEIDTRLRPGGQSGLVVSSLQGFIRYQEQDAWTWEHQALTRARFVCGDAALGQAFTQARESILIQPRNERLKDEVITMREKMRAQLTKLDDNLFDLKKSSGGLIDIEFIVQYMILAYAHQEPIIARMSDNIRQLAALEATGLIPSSTAMTLRDAYRRLRGEAHRQYLNDSNNVVDAKSWVKIRQDITTIWKAIFAKINTPN